MTREEAIEVYNGLINTKIKEAFEFFAPELRKINEEEIRKDLIGGLMWQRDNLKSEGPHDNNLILPGFCLTVGKHLTYLEKQKESLQRPESCKENADSFTSEDERIRKEIIGYLNSRVPTAEETELLYFKRWIAWLEKQKEQVTDESDKIAAAYQLGRSDERKLKEQKAIPIPPPCWESAIQEQKPNSTEDMPYITDEHFFEREPADSFKYKLAEYMTKCCTKKEGPYGYEYGISAESILKMAKEELIKRGELKEQKPSHTAKEMWKEMRLEVYAQASGNRHEPNYSDDSTKMFSLCDIDEIFEKIGNSTVGSQPAEWSEEDEKFFKTALWHISYSVSNGKTTDDHCDTTDWLKGVKERLKSLRPSWKPSEEQMRALESCFCEFGEGCPDEDGLRSLYNDLKKLMSL